MAGDTVLILAAARSCRAEAEAAELGGNQNHLTWPSPYKRGFKDVKSKVVVKDQHSWPATEMGEYHSRQAHCVPPEGLPRCVEMTTSLLQTAAQDEGPSSVPSTWGPGDGSAGKGLQTSDLSSIPRTHFLKAAL